MFPVRVAGTPVYTCVVLLVQAATQVRPRARALTNKSKIVCLMLKYVYRLLDVCSQGVVDLKLK